MEDEKEAGHTVVCTGGLVRRGSLVSVCWSRSSVPCRMPTSPSLDRGASTDRQFLGPARRIVGPRTQ